MSTVTPARYPETDLPSPVSAVTHHYERELANERRRRMRRTLKTALIVGASTLALAGTAIGGVALAAADDSTVPDPEPVVYVNGLAEEQEAAAAQAEADRMAAEAAAAEAARLAAEQAAAAEAQRVADEQAAAVEAQAEQADPEPAPPAPEPIPEGGVYDPASDSVDHAICEVLADGTQVPCGGQ